MIMNREVFEERKLKANVRLIELSTDKYLYIKGWKYSLRNLMMGIGLILFIPIAIIMAFGEALVELIKDFNPALKEIAEHFQKAFPQILKIEDGGRKWI